MRYRSKKSLRNIIERRPHWVFFFSTKTSRIGSRIKKKKEFLKLKQPKRLQNKKKGGEGGVKKLDDFHEN